MALWLLFGRVNQCKEPNFHRIHVMSSIPEEMETEIYALAWQYRELFHLQHQFSKDNKLEEELGVSMIYILSTLDYSNCIYLFHFLYRPATNWASTSNFCYPVNVNFMVLIVIHGFFPLVLFIFSLPVSILDTSYDWYWKGWKCLCKNSELRSHNKIIEMWFLFFSL